MNFKEDYQGLTYINVGEHVVIFAQKVHQSCEGYTKKQFQGEIMAHKASGFVGHSYEQDLK